MFIIILTLQGEVGKVRKNYNYLPKEEGKEDEEKVRVADLWGLGLESRIYGVRDSPAQLHAIEELLHK